MLVHQLLENKISQLNFYENDFFGSHILSLPYATLQ